MIVNDIETEIKYIKRGWEYWENILRDYKTIDKYVIIPTNTDLQNKQIRKYIKYIQTKNILFITDNLKIYDEVIEEKELKLFISQEQMNAILKYYMLHKFSSDIVILSIKCFELLVPESLFSLFTVDEVYQIGILKRDYVE